MNKFLSAVIFIILSGSISSCSLLRHKDGKRKKKNKKETVAATDSVRIDTAIAQLPDTVAAPADTALLKSMIAEVMGLWQHKTDFNTFSGKAKVRFEEPDGSKEFTAHFRVRKDSVIWVNITAIGLSVARVFITPDSFFLVNTLQKEAMRIALADAAKVLPSAVEFSSLQNLVLGQPLRGGDIVNASANDAGWDITVQDTSYRQQLTYARTDSNMATGRLSTLRPGGPEASSAYSDYQLNAGRKIAAVRKLVIVNKGETYILDMDFSNMVFDQPLDYPFSIPKNYKIK